MDLQQELNGLGAMVFILIGGMTFTRLVSYSVDLKQTLYEKTSFEKYEEVDVAQALIDLKKLARENRTNEVTALKRVKGKTVRGASVLTESLREQSLLK